MENYNNNEYNQPQQQYSQPYAPEYEQPAYQQYDPTKEVLSVGSYIGMFILSSIPIVNIICWIVWLVSSKTNKNKKNYVIASIIIWIIGVIISAILTSAGIITGFDFFNSF